MIGLASELVTTGPEYAGLATYLLGRVLVVDHIDNAIAIARKYRHSLRMVTVEGEPPGFRRPYSNTCAQAV